MTVVVVLDSDGGIVLQTMVPTDKASIIRLVQSLSGPLWVTFEETTQAAWLYEIIRAYVTEVVVCDPRRNKLLEERSKFPTATATKLLGRPSIEEPNVRVLTRLRTNHTLTTGLRQRRLRARGVPETSSSTKEVFSLTPPRPIRGRHINLSRCS